jgi:hypothetical protein
MTGTAAATAGDDVAACALPDSGRRGEGGTVAAAVPFGAADPWGLMADRRFFMMSAATAFSAGSGVLWYKRTTAGTSPFSRHMYSGLSG